MRAAATAFRLGPSELKPCLESRARTEPDHQVVHPAMDGAGADPEGSLDRVVAEAGSEQPDKLLILRPLRRGQHGKIAGFEREGDRPLPVRLEQRGQCVEQR